MASFELFGESGGESPSWPRLARRPAWRRKPLRFTLTGFLRQDRLDVRRAGLRTEQDPCDQSG